MNEAELLRLEDAHFVEQAYQVVLGRPADPMGRQAYLGRVRSGTPKALIVHELRHSAEGLRRAARTGQPVWSSAPPPSTLARVRPPTPELHDLLRLPDAAFVEAAYRMVLGRPVDASGRANYLQELRAGVGRLEVLNELLQSAEGRRVNAPLPALRELLRRRRWLRLPVVRHALRRLRAWTARRRSEPARATGTLTSLPPPSAAARQGHDPYQPRGRPRHGSQHPPRPITMSTTAPPTEPSPAATMPAEAPEWQVDAQAVEETAQGPAQLHAERLVGPILHGWSVHGGRAAACTVSLAKRALGRLVPHVARPEIQSAHDLAEPVVGFSAVLGGLLQFSVMAPGCAALGLLQEGSDGIELEIDLRRHQAEALTFSPMRALLRPVPRPVGQLRSMRMVSPTELAIVFEADAIEGEQRPELFLDFYQARGAQAGPQDLVRIGRFGVELGGQLHDLNLRLLDPLKAVLMVVTDARREIVVTDCLPLPVLFADRHAPLVDYHVTLESGKSALGVVAKIARSFLDAAVQAADAGAVRTAPNRESTCLILYARGAADLMVADLRAAHAPLAAECVVLDNEGRVHRADGAPTTLGEHVSASSATHFLIHDAEADLRPDFWTVIDGNRFRLAGEPAVVHWHVLWIDGTSRPQVVKAALLLDPAFAGHQLLEARSLLVNRATMLQALENRREQFASGRLVLERAFDFVPAAAVTCVPVVMHTVRPPITPLQAQRYQAAQVVMPAHPAQAARAAEQVRAAGGPGVSVIINYRDSVADTLRCLESLAMQDLDGPMEVVLVNNGSMPASVDTVLGRARELFGRDAVRDIEYPHRFNHSTQCNVAAEAARHDMLLMLSNDSVLITPRAVARSAAVAAVPWVGSVGFRIVGNEASKRRLQSLGLALNPRRYLFSGGSPVATNLAPAFALDCTFEVVGNTFAAVMLRREVYRQLDGLDSDAFPTSYNDIDFSFRATNAGYRHVVVGAEIVEHVGRGSREADQDLPIDQRIIERAPRLDILARVGFQQL
jgi:GT2 family glycosyltransferase